MKSERWLDGGLLDELLDAEDCRTGRLGRGGQPTGRLGIGMMFVNGLLVDAYGAGVMR